MTGIPDPGKASGYFGALERATPIVQVIDGVATTTSMRIANGTDTEHASVLRLIRDNLDDFGEFGLVGFEIAPRPVGQHGGGDITVAVLNEEHATLLLTYMRNNEVVKAFKKCLVREFSALRRAVAPLTEDEIIHQALTLTTRRVEALTARVAELEPQAAVATKLLDAEGDLSVRDTAQSLTRAGIKVGERRLFAALEQKRWIRRATGDGRYRAMQAAIEAGYMSVLPQSHYHPRTGILVLDPPQPRITPKGLQKLLQEYGDAS